MRFSGLTEIWMLLGGTGDPFSWAISQDAFVVRKYCSRPVTETDCETGMGSVCTY